MKIPFFSGRDQMWNFSGIKFQSTEPKWSLFGFAGWFDLFMLWRKTAALFSESIRRDQTLPRTPFRSKYPKKGHQNNWLKKWNLVLSGFFNNKYKGKHRWQYYFLQSHGGQILFKWHDMTCWSRWWQIFNDMNLGRTLKIQKTKSSNKKVRL